MSDGTPPATAAAVVARLRLPVAALAAGVGLLWVVVHVAPAGAGSTPWSGAAALAALVSPVLGYRTYRWHASRLPAAASVAEIDRRWRRATMTALAIPAVAAVLCGVAFLLGRAPVAYLGPAMHVLLTGALWPGEERRRTFERFDEPRDLPD